MIAIDTSSLISFFAGDEGKDIDLIQKFLDSKEIYLPPVVLSEIFSDASLPNGIANTLLNIPILKLEDDYWHRLGKTRSELIKRKLKARISDSMIAQVCIDYNIPLITRDKDFKNFEKYCGLKLLV